MKNQPKQKILSVDLAQFSHRLRLLAHQESRSMLELCTILDADPTRLHEIYLGLTKPDWTEVHQLANIFQIEPEFLTGKISETKKKLPKASPVEIKQWDQFVADKNDWGQTPEPSDISQKRREGLQELITTKFDGKKQDFANAVDLSVSAVSQYLNNKRTLPADQARQIEQKLGMLMFSLDNCGAGQELASLYKKLKPADRERAFVACKAILSYYIKEK